MDLVVSVRIWIVESLEQLWLRHPRTMHGQRAWINAGRANDLAGSNQQAAISRPPVSVLLILLTVAH